MEKKFLKSEFRILAKREHLDYEFSRFGLIESSIYRGNNPKTIEDEFYFTIKIVDDNGKLIHYIDIFHKKDKKNVIIKLSYNLRYMVDAETAEDLSSEEFNKKRVWYCPIDEAKKIKSIREILDHIAKQFKGGN